MSQSIYYNYAERQRERKGAEEYTHCVDKNVPNLLVAIPVLDPVPETIEKSLMEVVNFWYLIKDILDEAWICNTGCLGPIQRLQVHL